MKHFVFLLSISILFASCAFHNGTMAGNAALSDANFSVVDFVTGHSKTTHVFGIGGLRSDALVLEAKRNLYANHPLKQGQALANVTVDFKRTYIIIALITEVTVSAEVIDFNEGAIDRTAETNDEILKNKTLTQNKISVGSIIYIESSEGFIPAKVVSLSKSNVEVRYVNQNDRMVTLTKSLSTVFIMDENDISGEFWGFHLGDEIYFGTGEVEGVNEIFSEGKIIGINSENAAISYAKNGEEKFKVVPLEKLKKKE